MRNIQNSRSGRTHRPSVIGQESNRTLININRILVALSIATGLLGGCDPATEIFVENHSGASVEVRLEHPGSYAGAWVPVPSGETVTAGLSFNPENSGAVLHFRCSGRDWRQLVTSRRGDGRSNYLIPVKLPFNPKLSVPNL